MMWSAQTVFARSAGLPRHCERVVDEDDGVCTAVDGALPAGDGLMTRAERYIGARPAGGATQAAATALREELREAVDRRVA